MANGDELETPIEIAFHNMDHSDHIEHQVRRQAKKLERFRDTLIGIRVAVEAAHKGSQSTDMRVKVEAKLPGTLVVGQASGRPHHAVDNADAYGFIRDAVDNAVRRIESYIGKHFEPTKTPAGEMRHARITRLDADKGTGMLETETGQSLFFQAGAVKGEDIGTLGVGMTVTYTVAPAEGAYGPEASSVTRVVGGRT